MASIQSVQSGSKTITSSDGTSITISITSVTLAQSFLVCTWRNNDNQARDLRHCFTEELSASQITLNRNASAFATDVVLEWYVFEFDSSVSVQHGKFAPSTTSESETITSVNTGSTFVTASFEHNSTSANRWTADLTSSTNIDFDTTGTVDCDNIAYQVIEFDSADASVQKKTGQLTDGNGTSAITITSVDTSKTFIGSQYGFSASSFNPHIRHRDKTSIDSSTQITFERVPIYTTGTHDYAIYVVEMTDGSTVQSGTATITDTNTSTTATITALTNGGMIQGTTDGNQICTATSGTQYPEDLVATQDVSGTTLTLERAGTVDDLEIEWFAVEWNASGSYTLTADSGSYTITGTNASLLLASILGADSGTYTYTGTNADLNRGYPLAADSGTYTYTGTAATLTFASAGNYTLTADSGTYTYTGTAAALEFGAVLSADSGAYTYTGTNADLNRGYTLVANAGAYTYTGTDVDLPVAVRLVAESGGYTYNGTAATLDFSGQVWTVQGNATTVWTTQNDSSTTWSIQ